MQAHYDKGKALLSVGDFPTAVLELQHCAVLKPASSAVYYRLGEAQLGAGDVIGATQSLKVSVKLDPQNPKPHALLGRAYLFGRQYSDASLSLNSALTLHSEDARVLRDLGEAELLLGNLVFAIGPLEEAVEKEPSDEIAKRLLAQARAAEGGIGVTKTDAEEATHTGDEEEVLFFTPAKLGTYGGTLQLTALRVVFVADDAKASVPSYFRSAGGGLGGLVAGLATGVILGAGAAAYNHVRNTNRPEANIPLAQITSVSAGTVVMGVGHVVSIRTSTGAEHKFSVGRDVEGLVHLIRSRMSSGFR